MELKNEIVQERVFRADFYIDFSRANITEARSADYYLKGEAISLQFLTKLVVQPGSVKHYSVYIKFCKRRSDDILNYIFNSNISGGIGGMLPTRILYNDNVNNNTATATRDWQLYCTLPCIRPWRFTFTGEIEESRVSPMLVIPKNTTVVKNNVKAVCPPSTPITFAALYDDDVLTDFELRGANGGVRVHRAALAAASPVLRRMLEGDWREAAQGHVDLPDVSLATLQHFKDYVYKNSMPASGAEHLLLLASRYMMTDLEQQCVHRLLNTVSGANAVDLIEFATKHKMTALLIDLLERVEVGKLKVQAIRNNNKSK